MGLSPPSRGGVARKRWPAYANNSRLARSRRKPPRPTPCFSRSDRSLFRLPGPTRLSTLVSDMPRPISVPPHLFLFANRTRALGLREKMHTWTSRSWRPPPDMGGADGARLLQRMLPGGAKSRFRRGRRDNSARSTIAGSDSSRHALTLAYRARCITESRVA